MEEIGLSGAAALLAPGAPLFLYGPYIRKGVETAPSNLDFDADLKRRNPGWGLRDLEAVAALAKRSSTASGWSTPATSGCTFRRLDLLAALDHVFAAEAK